ncbi:MAG TPA: hypothetical protein VGR36_08955 [Candidatus Acidoferrales bacterium]|nr:hypothetical protein [Candidatus Acidoferrales bacterium]
MTKRTQGYLVLCFAVLFSFTAFGQDANEAKPSPKDAQGFKEFSARVQEYVRLHDRIEKTLPKLKNSASSQDIADHERALAAKIREARSGARVGDIFTHDASEAFVDAIAAEFHGPTGRSARATIQQGEPIKNVDLEVNQMYPKALPYTSVPPTLLLKLPKLPGEVEYRIVDHDLLLLDVKANLVVDILREALP